MTRSRGVHGVVLAGLVLATAAVTIPARGQGRPITERDLLAFHWIADPQISPDGSVIAYTLVSVSDKDNRYETAVWMVPTRAGAEPQRLTAGPRDGSPRWAPDGRVLAFSRAADDTSAAQLYLLSLAGGEPRRLTDLAKGASGAAVWSPDGHTIAFTSTTLPRDTAAGGENPVAAQQLTSGDFDEGSLACTRDGSAIIFASDRVAEPYYDNPEV